MSKKPQLLAILVLTTLLFSCSTPQTPGPALPSATSFTGVQSGDIYLRLDDGAQIYVPAGATAGEVNLHFERLEMPPQDLPAMPEDAIALSNFYNMQFSGKELLYPVKVVLPYDPQALEKLGISGEALEDGMYLAFPKGQGWKAVYGVVNQQNHTFTTMLSELSDPLIMWDFYTEPNDTSPYLDRSSNATKYNGDWYTSRRNDPPFKFYLYNGAVQIDQPLTIGLTYQFTDNYLECVAQYGERASWSVTPMLIFRDGRSVPLAVQRSTSINPAEIPWQDNHPVGSNSSVGIIQMDLGVTPVDVPPEEVRAIGIHAKLHGPKLNRDGCNLSDSIEELYSEFPLTYTVSEIPAVTITETPAPTPTNTPETGTTPGSGMVNPATAYCIEQGNQSEMRSDADGNQYRACIFPSGEACDEWTYFNGQCGPSPEESLAQKYVGAYVIGEYTRAMNAPESDTERATATRIEEVVEAIDDHTIRIKVQYSGGDDYLILNGTDYYSVDLQSGQFMTDSWDLRSFGIIWKSGTNYLDYAVQWEEVIDGWTYQWKDLKRRDPYTYLLLQFEMVAEVYDPQGRHWGNYVDILKPLEVHIPR